MLTVGSTANQNGTALYEGVTVLFLAQVFGVDLTLADQIKVAIMCVLAGIGTAGVPGGSLPLVVVVLQSVGVPAESIGIILGVDRLLDMPHHAERHGRHRRRRMRGPLGCCGKNAEGAQGVRDRLWRLARIVVVAPRRRVLSRISVIHLLRRRPNLFLRNAVLTPRIYILRRLATGRRPRYRAPIPMNVYAPIANASIARKQPA